MWIADDGRAITNAWADPSVPLPQSVIDLIATLSPSEQANMADAMTADFMSALDEIDDFAATTSAAREAEFVNEWMPAEAIAHLRAANVDELRAELAALEFRWRLDAYGVVEMYLDSLTS